VRARTTVEMIVAMALVGSTIVAAKLVVEDLPVFLSLAARFALATIALAAVALAVEGRPRLLGRDLRALAVLSLTGVVLFNIFLFYGLRLTSAASAGVITATAPAAVAILSWFMLREPLSGRTGTAVILAVAGIAIVNVAGASGVAGSNPLAGNALVCGVVVCEGLFVVLSKRATASISPLQIAAGMSALAFLLTLPLAGYDAATTDLGATTLRDWLPVMYLALAGSLAYLLWYRGLRGVAASAAGVFTGLIPISSVAGSVVVLGEPLRPSLVLATACVLAAIGIAARADVGAMPADLLDAGDAGLPDSS
jgi:drug/metabolite transporter (DMT)-like permease